MKLADVALYASEKYQIEEQYKWAAFPGFSVLEDPATGKWAVLLMRQWDSETGTWIERCDIKCGRECLSEYHVSWLSAPFRMKGQKWVGVTFGQSTDPGIVYTLLNCALSGLTCLDYRDREKGFSNREKFGHAPEKDASKSGDAAAGPGDILQNGYGHLFVLGKEFEPWRKAMQSLRGDESTQAGEEESYRETPLPFGRTAESAQAGEKEDYRETPLPFGRTAESTQAGEEEDYRETPLPFGRTAESAQAGEKESYRETPLPFGEGVRRFGNLVDEDGDPIPEEILRMLELYEHGSDTIYDRRRNFRAQGKLMEDYEDDVPWKGRFQRFFPTYHDLRVRQLRGYFTWRTGVRRGECTPVPTALAYIYIYELLNGIGAASTEDILEKLQFFEKEYAPVAADRIAIEDPHLWRNMHRWMLELGVVSGLSPDILRRYLDEDTLRREDALCALRDPDAYSDQEIFDALCCFGGDKPAASPIVRKSAKNKVPASPEARGTGKAPGTGGLNGTGKASGTDGHPEFGKAPGTGGGEAAAARRRSTNPGIHLLAETWRYASAHHQDNAGGLFESVFGEQRTIRWYPLENAVCEAEMPQQEGFIYSLTPCREYIFKDGFWREKSYRELYFNKKKLAAFLHETDRQLRLYMKAGSRLKEMSDEAWAAPYVQAVIEADRQEKIEAAKPKITIDFSDLDRIRRDANVTRESLLTEEERMGTADFSFCEDETCEGSPGTAAAGLSAGTPENRTENTAAGESAGAVFDRPGPDIMITRAISPPEDTGGEDAGREGARADAFPLDADRLDILRAVLRGESVREKIRELHGMPEVIADAINEALFDEIGDSVVECVDGDIELIEDYRGDVQELMG